MQYDYSYFLLDFLITIVAYLSIPYFKFYKRTNRYTKEYINKFNIINSLIVSFCFIFLRDLIGWKNPIISFTPAIIYYCINEFLWNRRKETKNIEDNYDKLLKLKDLLDKQIISQEEFNKEKAKLLK